MSIMKKIRNKGLWLSICAFAPIVTQQLGLNIIPHNYAEIVNGVLGALVVLGILNNPESGNWYLNNKDEVVENNIPVDIAPAIKESSAIKEESRVKPVSFVATPVVEKTEQVKPTIVEKPQSPKEE